MAMEQKRAANERTAKVHEQRELSWRYRSIRQTFAVRNDDGVGPMAMRNPHAVDGFDDEMHLVDVKRVNFLCEVFDGPALYRSGVHDESRLRLGRVRAAVDIKPLAIFTEPYDAAGNRLRKISRRAASIEWGSHYELGQLYGPTTAGCGVVRSAKVSKNLGRILIDDGSRKIAARSQDARTRGCGDELDAGGRRQHVVRNGTRCRFAGICIERVPVDGHDLERTAVDRKI